MLFLVVQIGVCRTRKRKILINSVVKFCEVNYNINLSGKSAIEIEIISKLSVIKTTSLPYLRRNEQEQYFLHQTSSAEVFLLHYFES